MEIFFFAISHLFTMSFNSTGCQIYFPMMTIRKIIDFQPISKLRIINILRNNYIVHIYMYRHAYYTGVTHKAQC